MVFQKKNGTSDVDREEFIAAGEAQNLPMEFICKRGCERSFVLVSEEIVILQGNQRYQKPGIRIVPMQFGGHKDLRIIRVPTLDCCTRANNPYTPEQVSNLIMADKRYSGEVPCIVSYAEWDEEQKLRLEQAAMLKKSNDDFEAEMRRKYGKRGAP